MRVVISGSSGYPQRITDLRRPAACPGEDSSTAPTQRSTPMAPYVAHSPLRIVSKTTGEVILNLGPVWACIKRFLHL